jgi:hypothetical protein
LWTLSLERPAIWLGKNIRVVICSTSERSEVGGICRFVGLWQKLELEQGLVLQRSRRDDGRESGQLGELTD